MVTKPKYNKKQIHFFKRKKKGQKLYLDMDVSKSIYGWHMDHEYSVFDPWHYRWLYNLEGNRWLGFSEKDGRIKVQKLNLNPNRVCNVSCRLKWLRLNIGLVM